MQGNVKNGFFIIIKIFCGLYLGPPWVLFGVMESQFGDGFDLVGEVGVGVNAGGGDAGVAQELLGGEHVRTAADEVGAVGMAQFMGREVADGQFFEECFIPLKEKWFACIDASFVSEQQKTQFKELISNRIETLSMPF